MQRAVEAAHAAAFAAMSILSTTCSPGLFAVRAGGSPRLVTRDHEPKASLSRTHLIATLAIAAGLALAGCRRDHGCVPGASSACTCTNGAAGAQTCQSDGWFGSCRCDEVDGGTGEDAGPPPTGEIFALVAGDTSIRVYPQATNGEGIPLRTLRGGNTQLASPIAIAVDAARGELFVANADDDSITVYPTSADGNVAPIRRIAGPSTGLRIGQVPILSNGDAGLHIDSENGELWVPCSEGSMEGCLQVFARDADGDAAPLRTIAGPSTSLSSASGESRLFGVAVDAAHDEAFVVSFESDLLVFDRTAQGDDAPLRVLDVDGARHVRVDAASGELWVNTAFRMFVFSRTASGTTGSLREFFLDNATEDFVFDLARREVIVVLQGSTATYDMDTGTQVRTIDRGGFDSIALAP
jgi:hypothetical protein